MKTIDLWKLAENISILQAILLTFDIDPDNTNASQWENGNKRDKRPAGYYPLKTAIIDALQHDKLDGNFHYTQDNNQQYFVDIDDCTVNVSSYRQFLQSKNFTDSNFFFSENKENRAYLDPNHPHYSAKLDATIRAWEAINENHTLLKNKTPKQALEKWLREHAGVYGFTDDDGMPQRQTIEDMAKVANWNVKGGVAKTHTAIKDKNPSPKQDTDSSLYSEDEEIPF